MLMRRGLENITVAEGRPGQAKSKQCGMLTRRGLGNLTFAEARSPQAKSKPYGMLTRRGLGNLAAAEGGPPRRAAWVGVFYWVGMVYSVGVVTGWLSLRTDNCEVIPAAGELSSWDRSLFPADIRIMGSASFELLGAAVGRPEFSAGHSARRVAEAKRLLERIGALPDPQIALLLLRQCASFGKIVFSARVTPYDCHGDALSDFDSSVRRCFERFAGLYSPDRNWQLATLATRHCGLGLRSSARHAPAAYIASRSQCHRGCRDIDPMHVWEVSSTDSSAARAVSLLNSLFVEEDKIPEPVPSLKQQSLSMALDRVTLASLTDPAKTEARMRAHIKLVLEPG
eukprot:gene19366-biopygen40877